MRVLIVEDEALLAMMLEDMVRDAGHDVVGVASDGAGAEGLARAEHPDVILMDINIRGDLDGVETARRLKGAVESRVIFMTAYTDKANRARMQTIDPVAVLSKPYDERLLTETLQRVAHGAQ
jgi:CheY-like chemotaxis protein